tara:strand:- start:1521 stop:1730 length:210 start_codon:yes stop_codon:yes gene_type:complete
MTTSQNASILAHLRAGKSITGMDALRLFGCSRLAARILDLRQAGHPITGETITTDTGKRCKEYRMEMSQ